MVALICALIATGIVVYQHHAPNGTVSTTSKIRIIVPITDQMICAHDAAWSPSDDRVALVGYKITANQAHCPSGYGVVSNQQDGLISVYQASTGRLLDQYHPDTVVRPLFHAPDAVMTAISEVNNGGQETPTPFIVDYTHILWAPDGKTLYTTWVVMVPTGLPAANANPSTYNWPGYFASGVVAIDQQSGAMRVMSHTLGASRYRALDWDLTSGQVNSAFESTTTLSQYATIAPAQAYSWTANGGLTLTQPAPTAQHLALPSAPASLPVNSPQEGRTFSVWQAGYIEPLFSSYSPDSNSSVTTIHIPAFATDIAAISPDGHYLVEGISLEALLITSTEQLKELANVATPDLATLPLLPSHDMALSALSAAPLAQYPQIPELSAKLQSNPKPGIYVAWRPDGRYLAAIFPESASQSIPTLIIYDTSTGAAVMKQSAPPGSPNFSDDSAPKLIRWSSDGKRLLVLDPGTEALALYGTGQLPH
jgi:WD40 repeat protein